MSGMAISECLQIDRQLNFIYLFFWSSVRSAWPWSFLLTVTRSCWARCRSAGMNPFLTVELLHSPFHFQSRRLPTDDALLHQAVCRLLPSTEAHLQSRYYSPNRTWHLSTKGSRHHRLVKICPSSHRTNVFHDLE